jgi:ABC-type multidrug transport system ATPase subunit
LQGTDSKSGPALSVHDLSKRFGDRVAFHDVSFEIGYGGSANRPTTDRAHDACGTLSKGLRQRVALARALLSDPQVLFLDEPTSGLDPSATRDVHELITALGRSGVTIFLTTHRLEEAERLCDRVAILNTTLRMLGRPADLRDRLFAKTLTVRTVAALPEAGEVFAGLPAVDGWRHDALDTYVLTVSDTRVAAPAVTRALVAAGADVLSISESHHSLEDVYLELIDEENKNQAHRVQRDPPDAGHCHRVRGVLGPAQRSQLEARLLVARPGTAHHRHQVMPGGTKEQCGAWGWIGCAGGGAACRGAACRGAARALFLRPCAT